MMKKTVQLSSLIKAKNDLELFIKVDEIKRLKKLFDPNFDVKDLNSKIESKEDQLITIKLAIDEGNSYKDENGIPIRQYIYQLSKYNRFRANLLTLQRRLETDEFINNESVKTSLLKELSDLETLIKKESDKKKKADLTSTKNKLKRSLSKITTTVKDRTTDLNKLVTSDLNATVIKINSVKETLTKLNSESKVEVDISPEFELIVK